MMRSAAAPSLPPCAPDVDHRIGVAKRAAVLLLGGFAVYALLFALFAHGAEPIWGEWAAGAYIAAAAVAALCWRRYPGIPLVVAIAGALAVPASVLPANWGATSEVRVVARAATLWLAHGTPYLAPGQLASWRSYDPYLPGMSLFGLPHALGLSYPLGDPLVWLAVTTAVLLAAACRIAAPGMPRCGRCRRQAVLRTMLLLAFPAFALPMALGVTDPPVIALLCLGLACTTRSARPVLAGIAIGVACALKVTAWPALPVVFALLAFRDGRKVTARFTASALGSFFGLVAVTAPALFTHPRAFWQNIVAYPLGLSRSLTQAASPLPGHLLAGTGSLGHLAAIALLCGAALAVGASLVVRPPRDVWQASLRLAVGLVAMFLLAPDARFGYFAYPLGILFWLLLTRSTGPQAPQTASLVPPPAAGAEPVRPVRARHPAHIL
ncbi:MAG: glycosyltransferase 87 family protein [Acidimicrobiales bacterium]